MDHGLFKDAEKTQMFIVEWCERINTS